MDKQSQAVAVFQPYFETALRHCIATGISIEDSVSVMLQVSCGAMKAALPGDVAAKEVLRYRDEIFAELTLCAERFKK